MRVLCSTTNSHMIKVFLNRKLGDLYYFDQCPAFFQKYHNIKKIQSLSFENKVALWRSNSFKKWPLNLWWISNKTIMEAGNITKAATFKSFLHLNYQNTQLLFLWQCFLIFPWDKHYPLIFGGYKKIWIAYFL